MNEEKAELLEKLRSFYFDSAKHYNDDRISSARVCKRALKLFTELGDNPAKLVEAAYKKAEQTRFTRRCYRPGVFYSWPYWDAEGCDMHNHIRDAWPAQRWPKDTLAFEVVQLNLKGHQLIFDN